MSTAKARAILVGILVSATLLPTLAVADLINFNLAGQIYTKWLYRNNDNQGVLSYGNPFWPDNMAGDNGVSSEFQLLVEGRVGDYVQAGVRIKSRFGALWQDWWENGDIKYDQVENTSGESLGMNRAQYMKLRGYWIRAQLPIPWMDALLIGSSDLGMFNPWTIGKIRFIDRDNGKGIFVQGRVHDQYLRYHAAVIALPKLWVGPGWSTGVGDPLLRIPFYSNDWAYGLKLESDPLDGWSMTLVGTVTLDSEIDMTDPDAAGSLYPTCQDELGNPVPDCAKNGAVDTLHRYSNVVATFENQIDVWDGGSFNILAGFSHSFINERLANNGVRDNAGVFPLVYDTVNGSFVRVRAEFFDVADGLNFKFEYFNIDEHFMTIFGARREADVLWTDGFMEGGQLPTLNLANEFVDFDEDWYESIVGWHGATAILSFVGDVEFNLEGTFITYNTNAQNRDTDNVYPDFLHTDGYTDIDIYDYANVFDRGRDLRSVYRQFQDRMSIIARFDGVWHTGKLNGLDLGWKFKYIYDSDNREDGRDDDDYLGHIMMGRIWLTIPPADGLAITLGGQVDYWIEDNRRGSREQGYSDDTTFKVRPYVDISYAYQGLALRYRLEYIYKDAQRERDVDRTFHVIRSKATAEVSW
ncbi:MAG: hypothetical protein VX223_00380 [Myxococcota bacterium]|nr:hypothetical protein [Myxococcota bacterium]